MIGRILLVVLVALAARTELVLPAVPAGASIEAERSHRLDAVPVEVDGSGRLAEAGERAPSSWSHEPPPGRVGAPPTRAVRPGGALEGAGPRSIEPRHALRTSAAARAPPGCAGPVS